MNILAARLLPNHSQIRIDNSMRRYEAMFALDQINIDNIILQSGILSRGSSTTSRLSEVPFGSGLDFHRTDPLPEQNYWSSRNKNYPTLNACFTQNKNLAVYNVEILKCRA
jgi:hypothetical protein